MVERDQVGAVRRERCVMACWAAYWACMALIAVALVLAVMNKRG